MAEPQFSDLHDAKHDGWVCYPEGDVEHPAIPQGGSPAPSGRDTKHSQIAARIHAFPRNMFWGTWTVERQRMRTSLPDGAKLPTCGWGQACAVDVLHARRARTATPRVSSPFSRDFFILHSLPRKQEILHTPEYIRTRRTQAMHRENQLSHAESDFHLLVVATAMRWVPNLPETITRRRTTAFRTRLCDCDRRTC